MLWHCLACGGGNPRGTKFCGHCGTPAEAANRTDERGDQAAESGGPVADERRLITALFADVSGFTVLGDTLELDDLHGIIEPLISRLAAVGEGYDGTIAKYAGDALLIFFGAPIAHEDHAERACMAALDMHRELERILPELGPDAGNLQMHIGVNTGHAIAGMFGGQVRSDYSILGDAVNVAQRLEASAKPGETFVGKRTYELTQERFVFDFQGELTLKGKAEPVPAWKLLGRKPEAGTRGRGRRLVGREREMGAITGALADAAEHSRARVVTVSGEPGVGKSRLTISARDWATAHGWQWLDARCPSYGAGLPYWPFAQLLREAFEIGPDARDRDALESLRRGLADTVGADGLASTLPYFGRLLGLPIDDGSLGDLAPEASRDMEPEAFRRNLHDAFASWLSTVATVQPLVLAIEDVHWGDAASISLAADLARGNVQAPVTLYLTARPEGEPAIDAVEEASAEAVLRLRIGPLDREGVRALVEDVLGGSAPDRLIDAVTDRTGGNPLFAQETVRAMQDGGALVLRNDQWQLKPGWDPGDVPATVEGVLAARLDLLPAETASVLQTASVIGRLVLLPLLRRVATDVGDVGTHLRTLVDGGFLDPVEGEPEELFFHHMLVTDVAYSRLLRKRRRELHLAVAEHARELYGDGDDVIDLLARHLYLGGAGLDAVDALGRAGRRARRLYANEEAILHLRRAAEVLRETDAAREQLPSILLDLGDLHDLTGEYDTGLELYTELRELTGDVEAWRGVASMLFKRGDREAGHEVLDAAFALDFPAGTSLAPLWLLRAWALVAEYRWADAVESARTALGHVADDDPVATQLLLKLSHAEIGLGEHAQALDHALEARNRLEAAGDTAGVVLATGWVGRAHLELGNLDDAADTLRRAVELGERIGYGEQVAGCLTDLGLVEQMRGNLTEAIACDRRAAEELERLGHALGRATIYVNLSDKLLYAGEVDEALEYCGKGIELSRALAATGPLADGYENLARAHLAKGRVAEAVSAADEAVALFRQIGWHEQAERSARIADDARSRLEVTAET